MSLLMTDVVGQYKQIHLPEAQLHRGLSGANVPGEPVAYLKLTPSYLARRYGLTFQDSFDNLDDLKIAIIEFGSGKRVALVHHKGFPDDETQLYMDRSDWQRGDEIPIVLKLLGISEAALSWRQDWPASVLGG